MSDRLTVLVTGADGFIGSAICETLDLQHQVSVVRAVRSGDGTERAANTISVGEVDGQTDWAHALADVDVVIHCAARTHVATGATEITLNSVRGTNVEGTLNLARQAADKGIRRFVFLSSVKVLGESTTGRAPFSESDAPAPEDAYGQSKWEAEQGLLVLSVETGMEVVVVRCPLVYGPGVKGNFRSLIKLADSPWPLPFAGIANARSLVYVGNLVDFLTWVIHVSEAAHETFLVSDGHDLSTSDLVRLLRSAQGRPARLWPVPWAWVIPLARWAAKEAVLSRLLECLQVDISKSLRLGWRPPFSVENGLKATVGPSSSKD